MFDHFGRLHERDSSRTAAGVALSVLFHLVLLTVIIYGTDTVRRTVVDRRHAAEGREGIGSIVVPGQEVPEIDLQLEDGSTNPALPDLTLPPAVLRVAGIPPLTARLPDTLELGRPQTIRLAAPPNPVPEDSVLRMPSGEGNGISRVRLSRARLVAVHGEDVVVEPQSPPLQLTHPRRRTEWLWTVTPTEPGLRTVHLQIDAPAEVNGQPTVVTLHRLRQEIYVETTPLQRASRFFSRHWTWVTLLSLLAVTGWARARWGERGALRAALRRQSSVAGRQS